MGQIKVNAMYIDKEAIKDLEKAGYTVKYEGLKGILHYIISAEDESADEITDSLRGNGWDKIDKYLVKESAIDKALAILVEEKQVRIIGFDRDAALGVLNKSKMGHSVVYRMEKDKSGKEKKQYGIVYGGKTAGWTYL